MASLPIAMNERVARHLLRTRSGLVCESCGRERAVHAHHRKLRSQGGKWSPANLLHLCAPCHFAVTSPIRDARELALDNGWIVPSWEDPATIPVLIVRWGVVQRVLLDDTGNVHPAPERIPND